MTVEVSVELYSVVPGQGREGRVLIRRGALTVFNIFQPWGRGTNSKGDACLKLGANSSIFGVQVSSAVSLMAARSIHHFPYVHVYGKVKNLFESNINNFGY